MLVTLLLDLSASFLYCFRSVTLLHVRMDRQRRHNVPVKSASEDESNLGTLRYPYLFIQT